MTGFVPNAGQPTAAGVEGAIGAAIGGVLSAGAIATTTAEVQKLVDSAKSGGFAISEEGANEYIRVFQGFEDVLGDLQLTVERAGQAPQLGDSAYARTVAAHTQSVATGYDQSYRVALQQLGVVVRQAREAFTEAKKHYAEMDDQAARTFGSVQV